MCTTAHPGQGTHTTELPRKVSFSMSNLCVRLPGLEQAVAKISLTLLYFTLLHFNIPIVFPDKSFVFKVIPLIFRVKTNYVFNY